MVRSVQASVPEVSVCEEHTETSRWKAGRLGRGPEGVQYMCAVSDGAHHTHADPPADSHRYRPFM